MVFQQVTSCQVQRFQKLTKSNVNKILNYNKYFLYYNYKKKVVGLRVGLGAERQGVERTLVPNARETKFNSINPQGIGDGKNGKTLRNRTENDQEMDGFVRYKIIKCLSFPESLLKTSSKYSKTELKPPKRLKIKQTS